MVLHSKESERQAMLAEHQRTMEQLSTEQSARAQAESQVRTLVEKVLTAEESAKQDKHKLELYLTQQSQAILQHQAAGYEQQIAMLRAQLQQQTALASVVPHQAFPSAMPSEAAESVYAP